jgi:hypothetical protein
MTYFMMLCLNVRDGSVWKSLGKIPAGYPPSSYPVRTVYYAGCGVTHSAWCQRVNELGSNVLFTATIEMSRVQTVFSLDGCCRENQATQNIPLCCIRNISDFASSAASDVIRYVIIRKLTKFYVRWDSNRHAADLIRENFSFVRLPTRRCDVTSDIF